MFVSTQYGAADIDPLDPFAKQKLARLEARNKAKAKKEATKNEGKSNDKGKSGKGKGEGKKSQSTPSGSIPIRKVWYEARSQGHSYYWNIDTNGEIQIFSSFQKFV